MRRVTTSRSVTKGPLGQLVGERPQERLLGGGLAAQGIEPQRASGQVDFAADQPLHPAGIDGEGVTEQLAGAALAGAPEQDDAATGPGVQVELPVRREEAPRWRPLDPQGEAAAAGGDGGGRLRRQRGERVVLEAGPDLLLPAPVEALDRGLKARLARRS